MFCDICRLQGLCGMRCVLFFCVLCERKKGPPRKKERSSVKDIILTMWTGNIKIFRRPFPSLFEKRPCLKQEGHVLERRRAYTRMQNVTHWFLVGYILGCRWWYMRVVRVVSLVGCKDYLSSHELSSLTYITPNESWNALCSLYAGGLLWARNYAQKGSVNSVGSVRERTPQELSSALSLTVGAFYFSQRNTEE